MVFYTSETEYKRNPDTVPEKLKIGMAMKTSGKCSGAVKWGNNSKNEIIYLKYRCVELFIDSQDNIFISGLWTHTINLLIMLLRVQAR